MAFLGWAPIRPSGQYVGYPANDIVLATGVLIVGVLGVPGSSTQVIDPAGQVLAFASTTAHATYTTVTSWVPAGVNLSSPLLYSYDYYGGGVAVMRSTNSTPALDGGISGVGSQGGTLLIDAWIDGAPSENSLFITLTNDWYYGDSWTYSWGYGPPHLLPNIFWTQHVACVES